MFKKEMELVTKTLPLPRSLKGIKNRVGSGGVLEDLTAPAGVTELNLPFFDDSEIAVVVPVVR